MMLSIINSNRDGMFFPSSMKTESIIDISTQSSSVHLGDPSLVRPERSNL